MVKYAREVGNPTKVAKARGRYVFVRVSVAVAGGSHARPTVDWSGRAVSVPRASPRLCAPGASAWELDSRVCPCCGARGGKKRVRRWRSREPTLRRRPTGEEPAARAFRAAPPAPVLRCARPQHRRRSTGSLAGCACGGSVGRRASAGRAVFFFCEEPSSLEPGPRPAPATPCPRVPMGRCLKLRRLVRCTGRAGLLAGCAGRRRFRPWRGSPPTDRACCVFAQKLTRPPPLLLPFHYSQRPARPLQKHARVGAGH